jgi:hypothetical protein
MKLPVARLGLALAMVCLMSFPALADSLPATGCNADNSVCVDVEGQTMFYANGGLGISGDVVLIDGAGNFDDVFRIFNDVIDTGSGTGLGDFAFLFGSDTGLPDPSTFSANAIGILLGVDNGTGIPLLNVPGFVETEFSGNGTNYELFSPTPEPPTWQLQGIALVLVGGLLWKRASAS